MDDIIPSRLGTPAPLPFYIAATLHTYGQAIAALQHGASPPGISGPDADRFALLRDQTSIPRIQAVSADRMREMLDGINKWHRHPFTRKPKDPPEIWAQGATRLIDHGAARANAPVILVVPSLINRPWILDLLPGASFMDWLRDAGLRPVLLDWGLPGADEAEFSVSDYVSRRMIPAARHLIAQTGAPISVLGYCMGGTMSLALAAELGPDIARLGLIGTPWDFDSLSGEAAHLRQVFEPQDGAFLQAQIQSAMGDTARIPADFFQFLFALIAPLQAARKFRRFNRLPQDSPAAQKFVAVEEWLNDPVPVTMPATLELLIEWFHNNRTGDGNWAPVGQPVSPSTITAPTLLISGTRDHIAPPGCSAPLAAQIPDARSLQIDTGHVGLIVGSAAETQVAKPLSHHFLGHGG